MLYFHQILLNTIENNTFIPKFGITYFKFKLIVKPIF